MAVPSVHHDGCTKWMYCMRQSCFDEMNSHKSSQPGTQSTTACMQVVAAAGHRLRSMFAVLVQRRARSQHGAAAQRKELRVWYITAKRKYITAHSERGCILTSRAALFQSCTPIDATAFGESNLLWRLPTVMTVSWSSVAAAFVLHTS